MIAPTLKSVFRAASLLVTRAPFTLMLVGSKGGGATARSSS